MVRAGATVVTVSFRHGSWTCGNNLLGQLAATGLPLRCCSLRLLLLFADPQLLIKFPMVSRGYVWLEVCTKHIFVGSGAGKNEQLWHWTGRSDVCWFILCHYCYNFLVFLLSYLSNFFFLGIIANWLLQLVSLDFYALCQLQLLLGWLLWVYFCCSLFYSSFDNSITRLLLWLVLCFLLRLRLIIEKYLTISGLVFSLCSLILNWDLRESTSTT